METSTTMTVGIDISDRHSHLCFLDESGEVMRRMKVPTTEIGFRKAFEGEKPKLVALEASTHSPWISRLLSELAHEVLVANPRQLKLISESHTKNDANDAELLARMARADKKLLRPVHHRSREAQLELAIIQVRKNLVATRSKLINAMRGLAKSQGERIRTCSTAKFYEAATASLSPGLLAQLQPLLETVSQVSQRIEEQNQKIEALVEKHPVAQKLTAIHGVGPVTSTSFVLTLDDERRFSSSRKVGAFIGLCPRQDQSGKLEKQLGITKAGDAELRVLLVNCAQGILRKGAPDSDLKRWGLKLASRGGKNAKKRAAVAVARKLAVLMHRLWVTGATYEPLYRSRLQPT